jgi:hypothetical protein
VYIKMFGYLIAAGVLFTSLAMYLMGARWQAVEQAGYGGKRRPWWFYVLSLLLIGLYILAVLDFVGADKSWATWILVVFFPVGWVLKGALIIFNPKGRQAVTAVAGDQNWRKVALARLPIALLVGVLAFLA